MDNLAYIYFLSISENLNNALDGISSRALLAAIVIYVLFTIRKVTVLAEERGETRERLEAKFKEYEPTVRNISLSLSFISMVLWAVAALCPSTENVLKAYALVEGSKVINAPNAEKAAEAIGQRFDHFLDIVDRGINGRAAEPAKVATKPNTVTKTDAAVPDAGK